MPLPDYRSASRSWLGIGYLGIGYLGIGYLGIGYLGIGYLGIGYLGIGYLVLAIWVLAIWVLVAWVLVACVRELVAERRFVDHPRPAWMVGVWIGGLIGVGQSETAWTQFILQPHVTLQPHDGLNVLFGTRTIIPNNGTTPQ